MDGSRESSQSSGPLVVGACQGPVEVAPQPWQASKCLVANSLSCPGILSPHLTEYKDGLVRRDLGDKKARVDLD